MIFINTLKKTLSNYCDNNSMYMVFDICESVVDIIVIVIDKSLCIETKLRRYFF